MTDDDSDRRVFIEAMRGVEPLRIKQQRVAAVRVAKTPEALSPRHTALPSALCPVVPTAALAAVAADAVIEWHAGGLSARQWRQLRRGQWDWQGRVDIHGLSQQQAQQRLMRFIAEQCRYRHRCVLVVHGKGQGRLKGLTHYLLRHHPQVLAYHSALPAHGGTGAVYVSLKSNNVGGKGD